MPALFLIVLVVGLVLGVFAMLYGTERRPRATVPVPPHERRSDHDPSTEPSPTLNLSTVAALLFAFGLTGSILSRATAWGTATQLALATMAGAAAFAAQVVLVARWALPAARAGQVDERYLLQGIVATVVAAIPSDGAGGVRYAIDGLSYELPARAIDGVPVEIGAEVVIDRVEDGIACVEPWALVEQRL
jgi:hypothetical protein